MILDAHVHFPDDHPDLRQLLASLEVIALNVSFANLAKPNWQAEADRYCQLAEQYPQHYRWCTTFALPPEEAEEADNYAATAIQGIDADFARGAVACKVWKSYGMELRRVDGSPVLVDDPVLAPIFEHMSEARFPALMHIGDPLAAWLPLDTPGPHQGYYRNNPEWHIGDKPGFPSHAEIIAARDQMLANHPNLTVIGAHLGSLEHDVDEVAARLDRYPNFGVDISARLSDLMQQDSHKVRAFFERYQDRILFGTDIVLRQKLADLPDEERSRLLESWRNTYHAYCAYLENAGEVHYRDYSTTGLGLSEPILDKLYRENARRYYPAVDHPVAIAK
jgi:predicted TIM-barrel fold metal-dependent hydrolase